MIVNMTMARVWMMIMKTKTIMMMTMMMKGRPWDSFNLHTPSGNHPTLPHHLTFHLREQNKSDFLLTTWHFAQIIFPFGGFVGFWMMFFFKIPYFLWNVKSRLTNFGEPEKCIHRDISTWWYILIILIFENIYIDNMSSIISRWQSL